MEDENKFTVTGAFEEIVIDFGEICRFCLTEASSSISIYDKCTVEESAGKQLDTIYNFVTKMSSIKMEGAECFPSLVCENCYELIKASYNFSRVCQQSDSSLRDCYEKTLKEAKAKLNYKDLEKYNIPVEELHPEMAPVQANVLIKESMTEIHKIPPCKDDVCKTPVKKIKWKPTSRQKSKDAQYSLSILKADNIKLKYQRINSLSQRLKEAQTKLAEDILRSNDLMLGLPRNDELKKVLKGSKSSYGCPQCTLQFNKPEALKFHYLASHGQISKFKKVTRFQCKKCLGSFTDQDKLVRHYSSAHKTPESKLSQEELNYKVRKSVRTGKRKFFCLHCVPYKIFPSREKLVEHLEKCHGMNESRAVSRVYGCGRCESEATFSSRFSLNRHLRTVHGLRDDEITWRDVKCISKLSEAREEPSPDLKLFKVFVCTDCSPPVSFNSVNACVEHKMEIHDKELENISLKELSAVYVDSLDVFKRSEEDNSGFSFKVLCRNCQPAMEFTSANEFVNHMHSRHDESTLENWDIECKSTEAKDESRTWKCPECPAVYYRKPSLCYHLKEKHNKRTSLGAMECPEPGCSESFYSNRQLIQHGISVHQKYFAHFHKIYKKKILQPSGEEDNRIKNFECDICQKKYVCKNSLKRHILKTHLGRGEAESVTCTHCGKTLSNKLNLKSHIEFVHEALFVSCPVCKKNINFRTIGKHYKTHQNNSEFVGSKNLFLCNLCGKILKSKRGFEDHQKLHKNIRDQLCDICGSGFTTKKFLHLHKKIHQGVQRKVFACPQCDKVFSGRHTLNRHLLTHSGEKNFICEICSKCFYTLQELNRHVRCHKKEYRFDCQLCDMRFLDKSRFRHHMMRHRNIRPHKCQFCDKMFIVRGKMNLHMAAKHNVEVQTTKAVWKDPRTYVPLDDLL